MRRNVQLLLDDLASTDEMVVDEAILTAKEFIDETTLYYTRPWQSPASRQGAVPEDRRITALSEVELDVIVDRLLEFLGGSDRLGAHAAFSLTNSKSLKAIPALAAFLQRKATIDGFGALQAILAIEQILNTSHVALALSPEAEQIFRLGLEALQYASVHGLEDLSGIRKQATEASLVVQERLLRARAGECTCRTCRLDREGRSE